MKIFNAKNLQLEPALDYIQEHGYVVIENMLEKNDVQEIKEATDRIFELERQAPFDPGDGPQLPDDHVLEKYLTKNYDMTDTEHSLLMRRIRYTRKLNHDTPWPVSPTEMNKSFLHTPTLNDQGKSQRIWNLPNKLEQIGDLIEHPIMLPLVRAILGNDCVLSDISVNRIGPNAEDGGPWHIDAPLTQIPEPLPDIPLTVQNAWMLDDFTTENGATRLVPGSHKRRKKPGWGSDHEEGEIIVNAPAGSMAMWLSHTWHRSGPNLTNKPRSAILGYFCRSWVKPFSDYTRSMSDDVIKRYSPTARYLLGWSAFGPQRG